MHCSAHKRRGKLTFTPLKETEANNNQDARKYTASAVVKRETEI